MSVIRSMRKISRYEFEKNYTDFVHEITPQLKKISKRRKEFVYNPLADAISIAYSSILKVHTYLFTKKNDVNKEIAERIAKAAYIDVLYIQKPLLIYWNIFKVDFEKQCRFADMLNKELRLLLGIINKYRDKEVVDMDKEFDITLNPNRTRKYPKANRNISKMPYKFYVLDWGKINSMDITRTACILHRNIHGKVVRGVHELGYTEAPIVVRIIDDFFVNIILATKMYPNSH